MGGGIVVGGEETVKRREKRIKARFKDVDAWYFVNPE